MKKSAPIVILVAVIIALLPLWPYSHWWGYAPSAWVVLLGGVFVMLRSLETI